MAVSSAHPNDSPSNERLVVALVDLSGETTVRYSPLAALSLKAAADAHPRLLSRISVRVHAFTQAHSATEIVDALVVQHPDVVALCCQGWNFRQLVALLPTIERRLPTACIVLGGNHVTGRAAELLPAHPEVDVVVNGEGEHTFADLLVALVDGAQLQTVLGLSARGQDGELFSTAARPRTRSMTEIPSAWLLPDVSYRDFDVALLETNRGCPYACAFCYWGGRVGQRIARGLLERVEAEVEAIAAAGIPTVFLCDANFGMLPEDVQVARILVGTRQRYGVPHELNFNLAKNHAGRVEEILRILRDGGVRTMINIPLQTLSVRALRMSGRSETGRDEMVALARRLVAEGTEVHCELIFGLPGESLSAFRANYDVLYRQFPILRIHPLWLLPNTAYARDRDALGIRTVSPDPTSDYEAVVAHLELSMQDTRDGLAMLLAHSILNLLGSARNTLRLLARYDGRSAAALVCALEGFLRTRRDSLGGGLYALFETIRRACYFERGLRAEKRALLYDSRQATYEMLVDFLDDQGLPPEIRTVALELLAFDCALLPRSDLLEPPTAYSTVEASFDPVELSRRLLAEGEEWRDCLAAARPTRTTLSHAGGLARLDGRNCDLTGTWHGRVVACAEAARGE